MVLALNNTADRSWEGSEQVASESWTNGEPSFSVCLKGREEIVTRSWKRTIYVIQKEMPAITKKT